MAKKKEDIKVKDLTQLRSDLKREKAALIDLRLDHSQFKLKNTRQIFNKRKEIARILSLIRIKELTAK